MGMATETESAPVQKALYLTVCARTWCQQVRNVHWSDRSKKWRFCVGVGVDLTVERGNEIK